MTEPDSDFVRVAGAHLSSLFGRAIEKKGLSAGEIARACGGVESGWRNKLSGRRLFRLQDVLSLAATYDLNLLNLLAPAGDALGAPKITTINDLVPPEYAKLVEVQPHRIPTLRDPTHMWATLQHQLEAWVEAEVASGRGAQLTEDVIVHHVLGALHALGLPSRTAQLKRGTDNARLTWSTAGSVVDLYFSSERRPPSNWLTEVQIPAQQIPGQRGDAHLVMVWVTGTEHATPAMDTFSADLATYA